MSHLIRLLIINQLIISQLIVRQFSISLWVGDCQSAIRALRGKMIPLTVLPSVLWCILSGVCDQFAGAVCPESWAQRQSCDEQQLWPHCSPDELTEQMVETPAATPAVLQQCVQPPCYLQMWGWPAERRWQQWDEGTWSSPHSLRDKAAELRVWPGPGLLPPRSWEFVSAWTSARLVDQFPSQTSSDLHDSSLRCWHQFCLLIFHLVCLWGDLSSLNLAQLWSEIRQKFTFSSLF